MVGVVGASDKTAVTVGTGGLQMHPAFLTLSNINSEVCMKESNGAWICTALMPIPRFQVHPDFQSILAARVWHKCVDIFSARLKSAARYGFYMADPQGDLRLSHTPLVGWIADLQEQLLISVVAQSGSPTSMATTNQFGDPFPHPPRIGADTLHRLFTISQSTDPWDLAKFQAEAKALNLSGVHLPFWRDWFLADPSKFLNPEILHTGHKMFYDHVLGWCKEAVGPPELDARYASLHTRVGVRHFDEGICHIKQMTGREHREIERTIVALIAGACSPGFVRAIRGIMDFLYQIQAFRFTDDSIASFVDAMAEFHLEKHHILAAGARRGEKTVIEHFNIPKLEALQNVARAIRGNGNLMQWSADATERLLQTHCKHTFRRGTNHKMFDEQCVRMLDRLEKIRMFDIFTALKSRGLRLINNVGDISGGVESHPLHRWLSVVAPGEKIVTIPRPIRNFFLKGTISHDSLTAFHLTIAPDILTISLDDAAIRFQLPDLRAALGDYHAGLSYSQRNGRRISSPNTNLPFDNIRVWFKLRLQQHSIHNETRVLPSRTIQALPPSTYNKSPHCDTVLINAVDDDQDSGTPKITLFQCIFMKPISRFPSCSNSNHFPTNSRSHIHP